MWVTRVVAQDLALSPLLWHGWCAGIRAIWLLVCVLSWAPVWENEHEQTQFTMPHKHTQIPTGTRPHVNGRQFQVLFGYFQGWGPSVKWWDEIMLLYRRVVCFMGAVLLNIAKSYAAPGYAFSFFFERPDRDHDECIGFSPGKFSPSLGPCLE